MADTLQRLSVRDKDDIDTDQASSAHLSDSADAGQAASVQLIVRVDSGECQARASCSSDDDELDTIADPAHVSVAICAASDGTSVDIEADAREAPSQEGGAYPVRLLLVPTADTAEGGSPVAVHLACAAERSDGTVASQEQLSVVLLGPAAAGKSSAGNALLGRPAFATKPSAGSMAPRCQVATGVCGGRPMTVVDTRGCASTVPLALELCGGSCSALAVCVAAGARFGHRQAAAVDALRITLGTAALRERGLVVFTGGDVLAGEGVSVGQLLSSAPRELQAMVEACAGRYVVMDNTLECGAPEAAAQAAAFVCSVEAVAAQGGSATAAGAVERPPSKDGNATCTSSGGGGWGSWEAPIVRNRTASLAVAVVASVLGIFMVAKTLSPQRRPSGACCGAKAARQTWHGYFSYEVPPTCDTAAMLEPLRLIRETV